MVSYFSLKKLSYLFFRVLQVVSICMFIYGCFLFYDSDFKVNLSDSSTYMKRNPDSLFEGDIYILFSLAIYIYSYFEVNKRS